MKLAPVDVGQSWHFAPYPTATLSMVSYGGTHRARQPPHRRVPMAATRGGL